MCADKINYEDAQIKNPNDRNILAKSEDEIILKGIASSPGSAHGNVFIVNPQSIASPEIKIKKSEIENELKRFEKAKSDLEKEYHLLEEKVKDEAGNISAIIDANLMIINDPFFQDAIKKRINDGYSAELAIIQEIDEQKSLFQNAKDAIFRERAAELNQIKENFLDTLRDSCILYSQGKDKIVVAHSLTPSDIVKFHEAGIIAIITEVGGIASHTSIMARSMDIPAVIGVKDALNEIDKNSRIIIDGFAGFVILRPSEESRFIYEIKKREEREYKKQLGSLINIETKTEDGRKIKALTNIDFLQEMEASVMVGADGVGLVRTEHMIFPTRTFPNEDTQYQWYKDFAERAYPNYVTIRVFDVGSDKYAEGIPHHENNPALGFRGIRFLLSRIDLFKIQIKAILRASASKNIKLMIPMISTINEMRQVLEIIDECKADLKARKEDFDENTPIGAMIETPSAVMISEELAQICDFFSIGTNDLTQYVLAADRTNDFVADYFDPFHPAVLRMIKIISDNAQKHNIPVSLCGEFAGHAASTSLLIGLGIEELSVPPSMLLELKKRILETEYSESKEIAEKVLKASCQKEVREILDI